MSKSRRSSVRWSTLRLWSIVPVASGYAVKVAETAVDTYVVPVAIDSRLAFATHTTENQRIIGYTVEPSSEPTSADVLVGRYYMVVLYSTLPYLQNALVDSAHSLRVLYHDPNVRLLGFGDVGDRDYFLVLRNREEAA